MMMMMMMIMIIIIIMILNTHTVNITTQLNMSFASSTGNLRALMSSTTHFLVHDPSVHQ